MKTAAQTGFCDLQKPVCLYAPAVYQVLMDTCDPDYFRLSVRMSVF